MRRAMIIAALLATAAVGAPAPAGAASSHRASARLSACTPATGAYARHFDVTAKIRRVSGTRRMAIRFDLQRRRPGDRGYTTVGGLRDLGYGVWLKSMSGSGTYIHHRRVNNLEAPASYRMKVGFRWYGRHGRVLRTAWQRTGTCHLPDPRPNLVVKTISVDPKSATEDRYVVRVDNTGAFSARAFTLSLAFPSGQVRTRRLSTGLGRYTSWTTVLSGPRCTTGAPTATADAYGEVSESDEGDDTLRAACPGG